MVRQPLRFSLFLSFNGETAGEGAESRVSPLKLDYIFCVELMPRRRESEQQRVSVYKVPFPGHGGS